MNNIEIKKVIYLERKAGLLVTGQNSAAVDAAIDR
jgi:hypothetical protein